jgi:hypothetical protein
MIWPQFSEFSFGYAFTDNLVHKVLTDVKAVPIFPSLQEEGKPGKGYDVEIPTHSLPLFLQFKLPQIVRRHRKVWPHDFPVPYYRMHLMRASHSPQHRSLVRHAISGKRAFYVAPEFDRRGELNDYYEQGRIPLKSAFFDPADIGYIDDDTHHVAYRKGAAVAWLCSQPRQLKRHTRPELFLAELRRAVLDAPPVQNRAQFFDGVSREIIETVVSEELEHKAEGDNIEEVTPVSKTPLFPEWRSPEAERARLSSFRQRLGPARFASFISHLYLDCQLVVVGRDN